MNYIKIAYNIFVVKNQNGFNNALYDFMRVDEGFYTKQDVRSMVNDFPKKYPAVVVFEYIHEMSRINVGVLDKDDIANITESLKLFEDK